MKVIQVELEDWQVEVLDFAATRSRQTTADLAATILAREASRVVDETCSATFDPLWTAPIEYRLAHLLGRL
jgi:hypothetical protein